MPSSGSGEMLGGTKIPNGVLSWSPPASSSLASPSAFVRAWQEAHPPAQKMRSHRVASPVRRPASVDAASLFGSVNNKNDAAPMPPSTSAEPISFRHSPSGQSFLMRNVSWQVWQD